MRRWMLAESIVVIIHNICKSNHHALCLKLIQWYMSIISHKIGKKLASWIQQCIKSIIYPGQVGFIPVMQGWFNIYKSIKVLHHIKKRENKKHTIISIDTPKFHSTKFKGPIWVLVSEDPSILAKFALLLWVTISQLVTEKTNKLATQSI